MWNLFLFWANLAWSCAGWAGFCLLLCAIGWFSWTVRDRFPPQPEKLKAADDPDTWPGFRHGGL